MSSTTGTPTRRAWTPSEVAILERNYPRRGAQWCAKKLKRSHKSVEMKAFRLGVSQQELAGHASLSEVARAAGRRYNTVWYAARAEGALKHGRFVAEKWADAYIERCHAWDEAETAGYVSLKQAARELHCHPGTLHAAITEARGRYKALAQARTIRGRQGRWYIDPWAVREAMGAGE